MPFSSARWNLSDSQLVWLAAWGVRVSTMLERGSVTAAWQAVCCGLAVQAQRLAQQQLVGTYQQNAGLSGTSAAPQAV